MKGIKLTIYDWIAYLFPGTLVVWAGYELLGFIRVDASHIAVYNLPVVGQAILIFIGCYSAGHILHGVANFTIDLLPFGKYPPRNYFPRHFTEDFSEPLQIALCSTISTHFGVKQPEAARPLHETIGSYYWPCYTVVAQARTDSLAQVFLTLAGFYRAMSMGCFVIALSYLVTGLWISQRVLLAIAVSAAIFGALFLARASRFKRYLTRTVYADFLSVAREVPSTQIRQAASYE